MDILFDAPVVYDEMAEVRITEEATAEFARLPKVVKARVLKLVERLAEWPTVSGAKPLSGDLAGRYRLRSGDYRVQFHVKGETVIVERIGHRDGFYD